MKFTDSHQGTCHFCGAKGMIHTARIYQGGEGDKFEEICDSYLACVARCDEREHKGEARDVLQVD